MIDGFASAAIFPVAAVPDWGLTSEGEDPTTVVGGRASGNISRLGETS